MGIIINSYTKVYIFYHLISIIFTLTNSAPDATTLVYKGCSKQALPDPNGVYSQTLASLFTSLIQQSSRSKFYKSTAGGPQSSISGLYQCRGDLSNAECYNCVKQLPQITDQLCGKVTAARVQLLGCYINYQVAGFAEISGLELLFKVCSRTNAAGNGFQMRRDTALTVMQNGLSGSGNGFYTTNYQSVYVLAQCEGDLSPSDCGQCVKSAVQKAQVECGSSLSAQVYLHRCFISYSYYPNGVPTKSSSFSSGISSSSGSGQNTGKTVAIIVGGTACVGFLIIFALFVRGLKKKDDDF